MPAAGTGEAAAAYRLQALLTRCQHVAGEQGPGLEAEAFLQQTLQLAEQYGVSTWELLTAFVTAMLVQWQHEAAAVNALVKQQLLVLVQRPLQLLQCLLWEVWPELQGQRAVHVGTVLQLVQAALAQAGKRAQSGVSGFIIIRDVSACRGSSCRWHRRRQGGRLREVQVVGSVGGVPAAKQLV